MMHPKANLRAKDWRQQSGTSHHLQPGRLTPCPGKTHLGGEVAKAMLGHDDALHGKLQVRWVGTQAVVSKQELHVIPWGLPVVHTLVGDVLQQVQTRPSNSQ